MMEMKLRSRIAPSSVSGNIRPFIRRWSKRVLFEYNLAEVLGRRDILAAPTQLLFLGVIHPLVGLVAALVTYGGDLLPLFYPLVAGLAFVGPLAAVGIHELSRRRERGLPGSWINALDVFRSRAIWSIAALGLLMLTLYVLWPGSGPDRLRPDAGPPAAGQRRSLRPFAVVMPVLAFAT